MMDKNGIPYDLLNNIIPEIEYRVNNILINLTNFNVSIELGDNNYISIYKNYDVYQHDIELCSGFEKFITGLCIRIALTQLSNLSTCNFMIIDEGFSCLDSNNINNLEALFEYLKNNFDFIIIISHIQTLKGLCDNILTIKVDKNNFSRINFDS